MIDGVGSDNRRSQFEGLEVVEGHGRSAGNNVTALPVHLQRVGDVAMDIAFGAFPGLVKLGDRVQNLFTGGRKV